jgi:hypothetical protein
MIGFEWHKIQIFLEARAFIHTPLILHPFDPIVGLVKIKLPLKKANLLDLIEKISLSEKIKFNTPLIKYTFDPIVGQGQIALPIFKGSSNRINQI